MQDLRKVCLIFIIISCASFVKCLNGNENDVIGHPVVNTKLGTVRGNTYEVFNSSVRVFYGIPFAKPPVGHLRFKHPVTADPWSGTLDSTRPQNACLQCYTAESFTLLVPESEDCLYLNVFVPQTNATELSVMFYIHGGGFVVGTASIDRYDTGSKLLALVNDVIVVTTNYRLCAFGYLFSGSPEAPGNAGILDNLMALQWVHDNIQSFGGDPDSVTVFGHSAGAFTTGLLMLSPLSPNLFHRAILISGSPISFDAFSSSMSNSFSIIEKLGNHTNCNQSGNQSIHEIVACLKTVSTETLDLAQESFRGYYRPVLDGHFFPNDVKNLYEEVVRKNISVMVGVTHDEGSMFVAFNMGYKFSKAGNISVSEEVLRAIKNRVMERFHLNAMQKDAVNYVYSNWEDVYDNDVNRKIASDFLGDTMFVCPTNEFGHQLSARNLDVYYYRLDHRPSKSMYPIWGGVAHGSDLPFIFGEPLLSKHGYTTEESKLSYRFMKAFGEFAKFGVPSHEELYWPRYSHDNQAFVAIKLDGDTIKKGSSASRCALWINLLPKLIEKAGVPSLCKTLQDRQYTRPNNPL